jgi:hypothetical protein
MRVILKPLGAVIFLVMVTVLSILAVISSRNPELKLDRGKSPASPFANLSYPPGGRLLISADPEQWLLVAPSEKQGTLAARTENGRNRIEFGVAIPGTVPQYHMVKIQRHIVPVSRQDSLVKLHFSARSKGSAKLTVIYGPQTPMEMLMSEDQKTSCDLYQEITLTPEWKEYTLEFRLKRDYSSRTSTLTFQPGQATANYEFSEVTVTDFGPSATEAK